jgi:NADH-quinone oxidoreductase subunit D
MKWMEIHTVLTNNRIWKIRLADVAIITKKIIEGYALTGVIIRGSNIKKDLRLLGYEIYSIVDLGISMGLLGDCLDRYLIRVNETFTSIKIIQQLFHYVKFSYMHNINLVMASFSLPCIVMESMIDIFRFIFIAIHGFTYIRQEAPKGELGLYIVSSNRNKIYRIKIRSPD